MVFGPKLWLLEAATRICRLHSRHQYKSITLLMSLPPLQGRQFVASKESGTLIRYGSDVLEVSWACSEALGDLQIVLAKNRPVSS